MADKTGKQSDKPQKKKKAPAKKSSVKKSDAKSDHDPYLVLARKYRPSNFDDLIGQEVMVQTLRNAFETGRIAQAYMLTGVRGVGKTTTARILARALNYELDGGSRDDAPQIDMPKLGKHCEAIMESRHVDVIEMDAASNTGIDDIREIIEGARYKPVSGRYKVYIIDEVHMLSKSAFNGLLKTLEEPPPHVKFIFATTELRKVPVTILSRCQKFDLRRISLEQLQAHYQKIAKLEGAKLDDEAISLVARNAAGSVRDGLSLLDQAIARASEGKITADDIRDMLGLASFNHIIDLGQALFAGDAKASFAQFDTLYGGGADPLQMMVDLARMVHVMSRYKALQSFESGHEFSSGEREAMGALATELNMSVLSRAWQMLLKGYREVELAAHPKMAAEMLLMRLLYAANLPAPDEVIKALQDSGAGGQGLASPSSTGHGADGQNTTQAKQDTAQQSAHAPAKGGGGGSPFFNDRMEKGGYDTAPSSKAQSVPDTMSERRGQVHATSNAKPAEPLIDLDKAFEEDMAEQTPIEAVQMPTKALFNFQELVEFVGEKRDMTLKIALEDHVELVRFSTGQVDVFLREGAPENFPSDLSTKLTKWTGMRWMVVVSNERGETPIGDVRRAKEQKERDEVENHPLVKATFEAFPNAEILSIKKDKEQ